MTSTTLPPARAAYTTKQKVGIVIAGLYGLTNIPSVFFPSESSGTGEAGPPFAILVISSALGLIAVVAAVLAWRGSSVALRIAAGGIVIATLTGLPAFFVDVSTGVKALVGVSVLITVVAVALMFSGRRPATVVD